MTRQLLACLLTLALTGCGVQPSGVITGAAPPSGRAAPEVAPAPPPTTTTLYLVSAGQITAVRRQGPSADPLTLLLAGPTEEERANGLTTEVPPNAAPFSVSATPSGATVSTPAAGLSTVAIAQIVCTIAAAVPVDPSRVDVTAGGRAVTGPETCPPIP